MRVSTAWSQDVVLQAMCENIVRKRAEGASFDFILATGDLAFSGKADEYKLVAEFFDALSAASGVPKAKIFCIPGNHDVERDRQKMCFRGARGSLQSQNHSGMAIASRSTPEDATITFCDGPCVSNLIFLQTNLDSPAAFTLIMISSCLASTCLAVTRNFQPVHELGVEAPLFSTPVTNPLPSGSNVLPSGSGAQGST